VKRLTLMNEMIHFLKNSKNHIF